MTTAKNPNLHTKLPADMVAAIGKGIGVWADYLGTLPSPGLNAAGHFIGIGGKYLEGLGVVFTDVNGNTSLTYGQLGQLLGSMYFSAAAVAAVPEAVLLATLLAPEAMAAVTPFLLAYPPTAVGLGVLIVAGILGDQVGGLIGNLIGGMIDDLPWISPNNPLSPPPVDPLVIDLNHDGISLISLKDSNVHMDMNGNGYAEKVAWVKPTDGLLAIDRNGNGKIDGLGDLFGNTTTDGFDVLRTLDSNHDNKISAADAQFARFC